MCRVLLFSFLYLFMISTCFAGEKEELQLQQLVYQERLVRLQAEFLLTQIYQKDVNIKIEILLKKEKEDAEKINAGVGK